MNPFPKNLFLGLIAVFTALTPALHAASPLAATQPAVGITTANATLAGMVSPNGQPTVAWFQWGTDTNYGNVTAPINVGIISGVTQVTSVITGFSQWRAYHFQLVASNSDGVIYGADQTFAISKKAWAWGNNYSGQTNVPGLAFNAVQLAGGGVHSLALDTTGNVLAWGDNLYGQSTVPGSLANVTIAIAAGYYHSLGLKNDGTVVAWGNNIYKQSTVPATLSGVIAIAGGYYHSIALKANGQVVAWGQNSFGQTNVPPAATNIVVIAAGGNHNLALRNDGVVIGWGDNSSGQLNIPSLNNVVALSAGGLHSMALLADGTVVVWGDNSVGQTFVPGGLSGVVSIAAGENHCEAVKSDGTSVGWGYDYYGQTDAPAAATNLVSIAAGGDKTLALGLDTAPVALSATVFGGANNPLVIALAGVDSDADPLTYRITQLPLVGTLYQYDPITIIGAPILTTNTLVTDVISNQVVFLSATNGLGLPYSFFQFSVNDGGYDSLPATITVNMAGPTYAKTQPAGPVSATNAILHGMATANYAPSVAWFEWGTNTSYGSVTTTANIGTNANVVYVSRTVSNLIATVAYHYRLVSSNLAGVTYGADQIFGVGKKTWGWGDDSLGQIDIDPLAAKAVAIAAGSGHSLAIRTNGLGIGWGDDGATQISGLTNFATIMQIAAGDFHSIILLTNGTIRAFGNNTYNQTNVPALTQVIAIAAGAYHNLALRTNGAVTAWGNNGVGQIFVPSDLANVTAIAAGFGHSMALKNDGTVVCWGDNTYGQTNIPISVTNVIAISAGANFCLALRKDGTVVAWGDGSASQLLIPASATNIVSIAAGGSHGLALRSDGTIVSWGFDGTGQTDVPVATTNVMFLAAGLDHSLAISADNAPVANPQTITTPQVTNLPIVLSGFDPDGDRLTNFVTVLPVFGHLFQATNGARGVAILSPNTGVTDPNGTVIFVPDPGAHGSPYASFQFAVSDRIYTSTSAAVTINIVGPPPNTNTSPSAPFATTQTPSLIHSNTATLNGMATANFTPTVAWFEWGTTLGYGQKTPAIALATNNGVTVVSMTINNLIPTVPYHCRLVASNQVAVVAGADQIFGVGKNILAWGDATFQQTNYPTDLPGNTTSLSSGYFHSLAVKTDGTGEAWGDNGSGQTTLPTSSAGLVQLTGGDLHTVALFADGTLQAVGDNTYGQTNLPPTLGGVIAIASGGYHNLALTTNGTVIAWGANNSGQINVPGANNIVAVAAGFAHSMALRNDGALLIWGDNTYGQQNIPDAATNIVAIAAGRYFCLALRGDGTIIGWGDNAAGQVTIPASANNVQAIAAGNSHSVALRKDGTIISWGLNSYGQTNAPAFNNFIGIAAGEYHTLAMTVDTQPIALAQTIINNPTNNLIIITLSGADPDAADTNLTFRIVTPPLLGTLYQFNPATSNRGPAILTTNVPVTDIGGRVVFVPNPGGYGAPYATFQFLVNDAVYDSGAATVTINIPGKPTVTVQPAVIFSGTNATLNGTISPNMSNSVAFFQWGLTTNYGNLTLRTNILGSVVSAPVFTNIVNLLLATNYHYRLIGSNAFGTNASADLTFIIPVGTYSLTNAAVTNAGSAFRFAFTGASNATYSIWSSTNLTNWTKIGTASQPTPGNFIYLDTTITNSPSRFYKAIWP